MLCSPASERKSFMSLGVFAIRARIFLCGGLVVEQNVAGATLRGLVELVVILVVVRLDLVVADIRDLDALLVEELLHHLGYHRLLAYAIDLGVLVVATLDRFGRHEIETHHGVEKLTSPLRALESSPQVGRLAAEPVGELAPP